MAVSLPEARHHVAPGVDEEDAVADDDGGGRAGALRVGPRVAGAEEDDLHRWGLVCDTGPARRHLQQQHRE